MYVQCKFQYKMAHVTMEEHEFFVVFVNSVLLLITDQTYGITNDLLVFGLFINYNI